MNHCSSEGATVGIQSYLSSRLKFEFKTKFQNPEHVGSPQVSFLLCTLEIPQNLLHKFFALNFGYFYFLGFSQTMSFSCIFVFASSFIHMDLSIVSTSTSLTFSEFLVLFSSISLLFSFIESHFALSSVRCHL